MLLLSLFDPFSRIYYNFFINCKKIYSTISLAYILISDLYYKLFLFVTDSCCEK
jgi:hypothetical protein